MAVKRINKQKGQNLFDFILSTYGSMEYLGTFLKSNNISGIQEFNNLPTGYTFVIDTPLNKVNKTYINRQYVVKTGSLPEFGDYNNSFNSDFLIKIK